MLLPKKDATVADRHAQTVLSYGHILRLRWLETRRRSGSTMEYTLYLLDAET